MRVLICRAIGPGAVFDGFRGGGEAVRRCYPATPVLYSLEPGEHVFDMEAGVDEGWVQEGLRFAARFWR